MLFFYLLVAAWKEGCERLIITTQKMVHFYKKWLQQAREYVLI